MDSFTSETEADLIPSSGSASEEDDKQPSSYKSTSTPKGWYQGHSFVKKNLHKPATCHHCSDLLWGILGTTGMVCEVCNFLAHEKCMRVVVTACTCIAPFLTKDPVPHCWSEIGHFKRKFCNVCRKRVDDLLALKCEICEYYSHYECLDFVAADCKQCAISTLTSAPKCPTNIPGTVETRNSYMMSRLLRNFSKSYTSTDPNESALVDLTTDNNEQSSKLTSNTTGNISTTTSTNTAIAMMNASGVVGGGGVTSAINTPITSCSTTNTSSSSSSSLSPQAFLTTTPKTTSAQYYSSDTTGFALFEVTNSLSSTSPTILSTMAIGEEQTTTTTGSAKPTTVDTSISPSVPASSSSTTVQQSHHWREGNLPVNSKCASCRKTCWSAECLTGIRCEWCGVTAHYSCHKNIPPECDFGVLRNIVLPPYCVSVPRTSLLVEQIIGMCRPQPETLMGVQALTDEFSSNGDSPEESGIERKSTKDKSDRDFDDYVRVYDGWGRFRKKQCRYLSLGRSVSVLKVIELSLKAFQLPSDEARDYYLVEVNEKDGSEHRLHSSGCFKSQLQFETRRPQILLRSRDRNQDREYIQTFPGTLDQFTDVELLPIQISVTRDTTVHDVIVQALKRFGLEHLDPGRFQLVETNLDRGLIERVMSPGERLWTILERVKRESVRALRLTRFYLQPIEESKGPVVTLFVGNLKKGLSQRLYERILLEKLGAENKWDFIEVIYYDFGSLVLVYLNAERADEAYHILKQSTFEDRPILAMILPRLKPAKLPDDIKPLLVLVNVKSGGCQGADLITSFRKLLNPHQVFNLDYGGPLPGLHCFRHLKQFKILVCGGDGTVGWALSCLDNVGQDAACPTPPMAILPLGTGNDLARVLRWGSGYTGGEEPLSILKDVVEAENIRLDRWTVVIKPDQAEKDAQKKQLQIEANSSNTNEDSSRIFVMNNYFGLGIDADLNLDFHMAREENPAKFNSRIHNKSVYLKMGLRKMVNRTKCKDLHQNIIVEVDGRQLDLPPLEGVIILNILSWGAGANPWGVEKDEAFTTPTHFDGQLEVVGVTGVVHMGQIFSGLRTGIRLAQGGHIRITVKCDIPVQVDGEPWIQPPGQIIVLRSALKATMLKKRKRRKVNRRHTEPGLGGSGSPGATGPNPIDGSTEDPLSSAVFGASGPPLPPESANSLGSGNPCARQLESDIAEIDLEEQVTHESYLPRDLSAVNTADSYPRLYRPGRPIYS
uniref:Diacylglycerol kinase n=1 Tax=Trichobilharzia regenti TaxID=157069 RepID=A0AA85JKA2_TRIRE